MYNRSHTDNEKKIERQSTEGTKNHIYMCISLTPYLKFKKTQIVNKL